MFFVAAAAFFLPLSPSQAAGQRVQPAHDEFVPNYFDPSARLPQPDISSYGRLRFLTTTDFPPFNFLDQTGHLAGFNVDLARAICEELDVVDKCQIQAVPWKDLPKALADGEGEAVIAGLSITQKARRNYAFTRAYLQFPARFVVDRASPTRDVLSGLNGKRVGVVEDGAHQAMLGAFFPSVRPVPFKNETDLLAALRAKKIDAVFGDGMRLAFWLQSKGSAGCCRFLGGPYLSRHFLGEGLAIAVAGKNVDLAQAFDHALLDMSRDGRFADIYRRYFPISMY